MIYIDGYGYTENSLYTAGTVNVVSNTSETASGTISGQSAFESVLATETANLKEQEKTYNLNEIFKEASEKYGISEDLLKAVAYNESRFKADATSYAGAMGIMQLMPQTAKYLGVEDAYDPYDNIMGGAKLLRQLSDMYDGDEKLMIAAYNAGSGNVEKYGGVPPFEETQNYVQKVLDTLNKGVDTDGITVTGRNNEKTYDNTYEKDQDSIVSTAESNETFSYDEYQLLMTYFEQMMKIIQDMGDDSRTSEDNDDDSLTDLFRLGRGNITYNNSTINLF